MEFSVNKDDRLDRFLRSQSPSPWLSKRAWDELLLKGVVSVNRKVVKKAGHSLRSGDVVSFDLPEMGILLDPVTAELVAEKDGLFFFQKPAGISTYPLLPWENGTLANRIAGYFVQHGILSKEEFENLGEAPLLEGGLLQRLDRDTSGIIACAAAKDRKRKFRELFGGSVTKTYLALVSADRLQEGEHRVFFTSFEGKTVKASAFNKEGKCADLKIKIIYRTGEFAWVEVVTREGFRHVIRAGMGALGCPLVGDTAYGGKPLAEHHMLHALSLKIPALGEFSATVPQSFLDCAKQLGLNT